ncbi:endolytic transglycosylase MltG [Streptomyces sp. NPDC046866]|uniref:endolytic transglycosylase MltG n=1 Tax=Streptomyces sp. NPDC046866 TaxID=3154921 RepID=UPI003454E5DA
MPSAFRPPRQRCRLTRRGRLAVFLCLLLASGTAVLVPLLRAEPEAPRVLRRLVVPEGWRAPQVYAAIDRELKLPAGSAQAAAAATELPLPAEAKGNPEGFLFPAAYPVTAKTTAGSLLASMVETANRHLAARTVADGGRAHGMTPYETATVASIVEAEADTPADMGKVARVVHNRLAKAMPLQMDSTLHYALDRRTLNTTWSDTRIDSPFNTYRRHGLPPTPIDNPGPDALAAAVAPTPGDWLFFVTVKPGDTRFSVTYEEHEKHVAEFNRIRAAAAAAAAASAVAGARPAAARSGSAPGPG